MRPALTLLALLLLAADSQARGRFRARIQSRHVQRSETWTQANGITTHETHVTRTSETTTGGGDVGALLALHNASRAAHGLPPLMLDPGLMAEAQASAQEQSRRGRIGHWLPLFGGSENAAWGQQSAGEVHRSWMRSPGHASNVVSRDWTRVGFGRVGDFWSARFR